MAEISFVPFDKLMNVARWDSEYYQPKNQLLEAKLLHAKPVPVSSFAFVTDGIHASPEWVDSEGILYLSAKCVKDNVFDLSTAGHISAEQNDANPRTQVQLNDVLVTTVGTIGNAAVVTKDIVPANMDRHLGIIRINKDADVDPFYLATFLNCNFGRFQTERESTGNVQLNLFIDKIKKILVPTGKQFNEVGVLTRSAYNKMKDADKLYPEAEAEMLERMGWDKLRKKPVDLVYVEKFNELQEHSRYDAEHFQPRYKRLRRHLLKVGTKSIDELHLSCAKGTQPEIYVDSGDVLVVKSKNVLGSGIDFESCERTTPSAYDDIEARLKEGDVVINSTGLGTLGRTAFIPGITDKVVASVDLIIWRFNPKYILPEYATLFLNSPAGLAQSDMFQTGSSGQLHLYPQHIKQFLIYLPNDSKGKIDLKWQQKLADKVIQASTAKKEAQELLEKAKTIVEAHISEL